jgi:hypothetical protein
MTRWFVAGLHDGRVKGLDLAVRHELEDLGGHHLLQIRSVMLLLRFVAKSVSLLHSGAEHVVLRAGGHHALLLSSAALKLLFFEALDAFEQHERELLVGRRRRQVDEVVVIDRHGHCRSFGISTHPVYVALGVKGPCGL